GAIAAHSLLPGRRLPVARFVREALRLPEPGPRRARGAAPPSAPARGRDPEARRHGRARRAADARARGVRALAARRGHGRRAGAGGARRARRGRAGAHGHETASGDMGDSADARLLIVAGEASGDAHAARFVRALTARRAVEIRGVAGPALRAAGVETLVDMS